MVFGLLPRGRIYQLVAISPFVVVSTLRTTPPPAKRSPPDSRMTFVQPLVASTRHESTGAGHHTFVPGPVTRALRAVFQGCATAGMRQRAAERVQRGLERVQTMEREAQWLKRHKSPLKVLGLPEHTTEPAVVKTRYRELLFETHPDTAMLVGAEPTKAFLRSLPDDRRALALQQDFELLQQAYAMATNPDSLWHQNGSAVDLRRAIRPPASALHAAVNANNAFAAASYVAMFVALVFFTVVIARNGWLQGLRVFDPDFFRFMMAQEAEERRQKEAGLDVDTEPARLAPTEVKTLLFPGRLIKDARKATPAPPPVEIR